MYICSLSFGYQLKEQRKKKTKRKENYLRRSKGRDGGLRGRKLKIKNVEDQPKTNKRLIVLIIHQIRYPSIFRRLNSHQVSSSHCRRCTRKCQTHKQR